MDRWSYGYGLISGFLLAAALFCAVMALSACTAETSQVAAVNAAPVIELPDTAPPIARKYRAELTRNARVAFGLDAPIPVLAGQIHQESGWDAAARSPVGAGGLAQFMPATAQDFPDEAGRVDVFNPAWALRAQSRYDKRLFDRASYPRECDRIGAMLSQYNGGSRWHDKRQAAALDPTDFWGSVRVINPGVTAASQFENADYPKRIVYQRQALYAGWGRSVCT